jgi:tetratricopeptide (TPR) repeat protein
MTDSRRAAAGCAAFLALWAIYVHGAAPHVTAGDSAELAAAAAVVGVAHSPGYPLYVLAGKAFSVLLPWGNEAYRLNLFSGFASAAGWTLLALAWSGPWAGWGAAAAVLAGAGPLTRVLASSAEVFGLNLLMLSAAVAAGAWAARRSAPSTRPAGYWLLFLALGAGCANQQTLVTFLPAAAVAVLARERPSADRRRRWALLAAGAAAAVLVGLSLYAFLFVRSRVQPLLDWEDPETWERFRGVVTRARYGTWQLAQGARAAFSGSRAAEQLSFWAGATAREFTAAGAALMLPGAWRVWRRARQSDERSVAAFALTGALLGGPLFLLWANVRPVGGTREVLERFLLLPAAASAFLVVQGVLALREWRPRAGAWAAGAALLCWAWSAARPPAAAAFGAGRRDALVRDRALNALRTAPPGAALIADRADETEFALAYLTAAEGRRPDLLFIDANAGVTRSVYGDDYYGVWGPPRLARRQEAEARRVREGGRPVFYATVDTAQIDLPRRAAGLLFEASADGRSSVRTAFPYEEVYRRVAPPRPGSGRESGLVLVDGRLLADHALAHGRSAVARRHLADMERAGADPWPLSLAAGLQARGRLEEAEPLYERVLRRPGRWPLAWCNLGALRAARGRWRDALDCYRRALEADPRYVEAHYNSGVAHWQLGDWPAVLRSFDQVLRIDPTHAGTRRYYEEARRRASSAGGGS